jgi:hypothetical protein
LLGAHGTLYLTDALRLQQAFSQLHEIPCMSVKKANSQ